MEFEKLAEKTAWMKWSAKQWIGKKKLTLKKKFNSIEAFFWTYSIRVNETLNVNAVWMRGNHRNLERFEAVKVN